ncbi:MAG: proton-conducting transporter membrane subunit [Candidatus Diapherotrites archaeon]
MIEFLAKNSIALLIALPLLSAFIVQLIEKLSRFLRNLYILFAITATVGLGLFVSYTIFTAGPMVYTFGASEQGLTMPSGLTIPVRIILVADAFSAFMIIGSSLILFVSAIYSFGSVRDNFGKYFSLFFVMAASVYGILCTGDLFNLFVFIEVLSISSTGLIAFRKDKAESLIAAYNYLIVSAFASLMILFGIGMLYGQYGLLNIAAVSRAMNFSFVDVFAMVLLIAGLAMKCGSVPMHFWVPDAYGRAPSAVTAFLVVSSQASLYALFRVAFTLLYGFSLTQLVGLALIAFGILSMFVGVTMALVQKDIKRLMAYHAVSQTGYMLLGVGAGLFSLNTSLYSTGLLAMEGGIFHIINHAIYKGLLFLTAGAIIYATKERDLNRMGGLARKMPFTTIFFIIGAAAIAGLPPTNGFASKLLIYESVFVFHPMLSIIAMIVSMLTLISFVKIFCSAFLGPERDEFKGIKEVPVPMIVAMAFLTICIILFGLFPGLVLEAIVEPAAKALLSPAAYMGAVF